MCYGIYLWYWPLLWLLVVKLNFRQLSIWQLLCHRLYCWRILPVGMLGCLYYPDEAAIFKLSLG